MQSNEKEGDVAPSRHPRSNGAHGGHRSHHGKPALEQWVGMGRRLPRKLRRDMETRPEAVLAAVAGASFLAGLLLGSRLVRSFLVAAVPAGIHHLVGSELGPHLWSRMQEVLREV